MADLDELVGADANAPVPDASAPTPAPEPVQAQEGQEGANAPQPEPDPTDGLRKALDEERGKRRKYRDELAEVRQQLARFEGMLAASQRQPAQPQQPPKPPPDLYSDPEAWARHQYEEAQKGFAQQVNPVREALMFNARLTAEAYHGRDKVQAAQEAFDGALRTGALDPRDYQRVMNSPNPFHEAVQFHTRNTVAAEIGDDPVAYRERVKAELLAEMNGRAGTPSPAPNGGQAPAMPASFAAARNAGPRTAPAWSGPKPLSEILGR